MENSKSDLRKLVIFFLGQTLSQFGSSLTSFALVIWAFSKTGEVMTSSMLAVCSTVPYLIVSLAGGSVVDRRSKKAIMLVCDFIAALTTLTVIIFFKLDHLEIWILYIVNAISGLMNAFQNPASQVAITLLVDKDKFAKFSGIQSAANSMLGIFSPILATTLLSFGGLSLVLTVDLSTFLFAFLTLLFFIKIPEVKTENNSKLFEIIPDIKTGLSYMKGQKGILYLLIIYSSLNFLGAISFDSMMSPLVLSRTDNNAMYVGAVSASMAISGALAGIIITISKQSKNKIAVMFRGILVAFIGITSFGLVRNVYLWCAVVLFGCFGMPFYFAYESAILRERVPVEVQGKLFALRGMIGNALTPIGYFLGAILADYIFEPFMKGSSKLRQLLTHVVGEGSGAGISLIFILAGLIGFVLTLVLRNNKYIKELN